MALDVQRLRLTDDHTLESASEVMSQLGFDQRLPDGQQACIELLRNLGFQGNQDGEEHTQLVFQGQCLILGDARVGKTSLKKSLIGRPFDTQEPATKGVEVSLVNRKWMELDVDAGLTFGSFARFRQSVVYEGTMYGPGGIKFALNHEITSMMSTLASFTFMLLRIGWIISIIYLLTSDTVPFGFGACSLGTFLLAVLLQFVPSDHPEGLKIASLVAALPSFMVGFGIEYLLTGLVKGIDCANYEFALPCRSYQSMWAMHLLIFIVLFIEISVGVYFLVAKHCNVSTWYKDVESLVPGQAKFNGPLPLLPRIFFFMLPVITGFSCGCIIQLSTEIPQLQYCSTLHLTVISLFCIILIGLVQTMLTLVSWQGLILILFLLGEKGILTLSAFCSLFSYAVMFAIWACKTLYDWWSDLYFLFNLPRETQASFTLIFIEKVMLNFQKLKSALHGKFSTLKLKLLDFSGDKEYYAYHHVFMRDKAMYIVVFNMANFVDNNFANIGAKLQRIRFWLESICSKAAPKTPIFLVGTHRGHMDKTYFKAIDRHLQKHFLNAFSDELVVNKEAGLLYFPTENSLGWTDREIKKLRKEIMSKAEELKPTMGRKIPYSWIKIQDAIINLRKNKNGKFCVTLQQFPISVGNFICSNWSKDTLRYFHEKGLVIYVEKGQDSNLPGWILLKPDILVDIIIKLVTPLTYDELISQPGLKRDWKLLHDTGMLTESLLGKILSTFQEDEKALKSFLEEYDLICPLFYNVRSQQEEARVTHFVPSLLPISAEEKTRVWNDEPDDKKFYVFFHRFLPEPLFQSLLSRAHRLSKQEFPNDEPFICRDVGRFWLQPNPNLTPVPYRLLQLKNQEMIEVTFNCRSV